MSKFSEEFESRFRTTGRLKILTEQFERNNKEESDKIKEKLDRFKKK